MVENSYRPIGTNVSPQIIFLILLQIGFVVRQVYGDKCSGKSTRWCNSDRSECRQNTCVRRYSGRYYTHRNKKEVNWANNAQRFNSQRSKQDRIFNHMIRKLMLQSKGTYINTVLIFFRIFGPPLPLVLMCPVCSFYNDDVIFMQPLNNLQK